MAKTIQKTARKRPNLNKQKTGSSVRKKMGENRPSNKKGVAKTVREIAKKPIKKIKSSISTIRKKMKNSETGG